jgi:hypothetical protein
MGNRHRLLLPGVEIVRESSRRHDEGFAEVAEQSGFYCSGVYPESYCRYDRQRFIDTLNDWVWFGHPSKAPAWYTGTPWS